MFWSSARSLCCRNGFWDLLDSLSKVLRGDSRPFGGLQVVLVGDMFQLPPVSRDSNRQEFAHNSTAWKELDPLVCYLDEQHRQRHDGLLEVLEAMRKGELNDECVALLESRLHRRSPEGVEVTRLYSHNVNVDSINRQRLAMLEETSEQYEMRNRGPTPAVEQLSRRILAPRLLDLKVGAEVMFVANDPSRTFVNGSRGRVIRFDEGRPIVALVDGGRAITVGPYSWQSVEDDRVRAEVVQLPLRLAWAITIHKSQGMSIDAAEIDLNRSFTSGMGYVALSRLRSLDGLCISGMNAMALRLHPEIFDLDERLRSASNGIAKETADYIDTAVPTLKSESVFKKTHIEGGLLDALYWRRSRAVADGIPVYVIAHNAHLEEIIADHDCRARF